MARKFFRLVSAFTRLFRDQNGQVVIYFTIMAPVMLGLVGLSLEGGRYFMLNSQLQNLADAAALAGAKELNGESDAITRATAAAQALSADNGTWWSNVARDGSEISQIVFYSALKGVPTDNPAPNDVETTDATLAQFIKVTTVERGVAPAFLVAVGAVDVRNTNATATAGSTFVACRVQPLMLCDPTEAAGSTFTWTRGIMVRLKGKTGSGGSAAYYPGDFGLLDPPNAQNSGATLIENNLAANNPDFCFAENVSVRPGQISGKSADGLNSRFDIYPNGNPKGLTLPAAPDVIKGYVQGKGKPDPCNTALDTATPPAAVALPDDGTMAPLSTPDGATASLFGNGDWSAGLSAYWAANHPSTDASTYGFTGNPGGVAAGGKTRFDIYLAELGIDEDGKSTGTALTPTNPAENPAPLCSIKNNYGVGGFDRRLIYVAVIDCQKYNVQGNSQPPMSTAKIAEFFLTKPSPDSGPDQGEIDAEFVKMITPGSGNGIFHQLVQLYRDQ